jgi:mannose-6-phosphate isomerase-like protein (cupin superfamily)
MSRSLAAAVFIGLTATPGASQEFPPSCNMCSATYIPAGEFQQFLTIPQVDQQVRSLDIGKVNVQVAIVHRGRQDEPGAVAEHSLVSEIYYILTGGGTNVLGPELVDAVPRPPTNNAVMRLNGPGHNAAAIRNGETVELRPGDVLVIPAGTGHQFTRIDDHITYLMIRVDPDKVVPLMDADDARTYLEEQARN